MVENNQSEATMYQYFTIVNDDKFPEDNMDEEATIVNSVDNVDENDQEVMYLVQPVSSDVVLNSTVCEDLQGDDEPEFEYDPLVCPQIEFILEDGQMYLNSNTLKDVDETYTLDADLINTTDSIIEDTEGNIQSEKAINKTASDLEESETNFWKVQLADGTCAFINNSVWASLKQKEEKQKVVIPKQEKKIICSYFGCNKVYSSIHHLAVHMRNHTGSRPYQCPFANCEKAFAAGSSLKAHLRTHTGEAPYGCMMCPKHFKTSGDLQKHVRTHTGEKPFKCPIEGCGRSFTTTNIRKVHIRSHTGERPFRCTHQDCNKAFASATNFKNHMRIHSGEKPYQCGVEGCGKRFTEYSSLFKHNAVHKHHQYKTCEYCGQQYKYETTLRTHVQLMHTIVVNDDGSQVQVKKKSHRHKVRILK